MYSLVLVVVSIVVGVALALVLNRTRQGKILRAVIHDREMSMAMGINVSRVYLVTFTVGAMLAALGGALTAPTTSVQPGIGAEVIVLAFAVVVVGGLGSLGGAALGALIVGLVRSAAVHYAARSGAVQRLRRDGAGADRPAQGPVRRTRGAQDMTAARAYSRSCARTMIGLAPRWLCCWSSGRSCRSGRCSFVTVALYLGIVVLGMTLLMRTGLVSFGQGLYYCLGRLRRRHAGSFLQAVRPAADGDRRRACSPALVAVMLGLLLAKYRDIFFAMLSLAFSMILYGLLVKTSELGSTDGFGLSVKTFAGIALGAASGALRRSMRSPPCSRSSARCSCTATSARTWAGWPSAIRDNELRVEYMGASVRRVIH